MGIQREGIREGERGSFGSSSSTALVVCILPPGLRGITCISLSLGLVPVRRQSRTVSTYSADRGSSVVHCYQPVIKVTELSLFPISDGKKLRSWIGSMSANVFEAPGWHFRDLLCVAAHQVLLPAAAVQGIACNLCSAAQQSGPFIRGCKNSPAFLLLSRVGLVHSYLQSKLSDLLCLAS